MDSRYYACADFETTTKINYDKEGKVRVWLWSIEVFNGDKYYGTEIEEFFLVLEKKRIKHLWFHNLKFDGTFVLDYALRYGYYKDCLIDGVAGAWYNLKLQFKTHTCEIRDSLKKYVDSSVEDIAKIYRIPGKFDKPDFNIYRPIGYKPTKEEIEYCQQDSHIIAVAMKNEIEQGHNKLTLASDCFMDLKKRIIFDKWYPKINIDIDSWLRPALKGGCTQLNPKFENQEIDEVWVHDETSEYPFISTYYPLPFGLPFKCEDPEDNLYVVKFKTEFKLKPGMLPTLQIKTNSRYNPTEFLTESIAEEELTLTSIDYELFKKHYHVHYEMDHEFVKFNSKVGIQSPYFNHWYYEKVKAGLEHNDYEYWLSKIRNNNSWGKLTSNPEHENMIPYIAEDGQVKFNKVSTLGEPIYLPHGLFVTAYARRDLLTCAQMNYNIFIYGDTDSVHTKGKPRLTKPTASLPMQDDIKELLESYGERLDNPKYVLGAWKCEHPKGLDYYPKGKYLKQKMYIHADENYEPYREYEDSITGEIFSKRRKASDILRCEIKGASMTDDIKDTMTWDNFRIGFQTTQLKKKNVHGGCYLEEREYTIT